MYQKILTPFRLTALVTLASVAVSVGVTWAVMMAVFDGPGPYIAYALAGLLPAFFVPVIVLPLAFLLQRLRRVGKELESLALTDALTGLPNRRAFFERGEAILAGAAAGVPVAAMMIDVDRFKAVNDEFGHAGGDALLTVIGKTIFDTVAAAGASESVVARLGGEEFALIVGGLVPTAVARLADRLCQAGREARATMGGATYGSTVSVGVAMRPGRTGIDSFLKLADDAVYLAKRSGRDRWAFSNGQASAPAGEMRMPVMRRPGRLPPAPPPASIDPNPPMIAG
ncbi:MAG: GGDEF domain-containing protein [Rhizobiales bacterium]|nr:GGDEF domain-containing protein [Hyphomicrobiales bacterium]MBN9009159.1 GGDEF domain-containing protein [Hyphomicrobiales bacterium]